MGRPEISDHRSRQSPRLDRDGQILAKTSHPGIEIESTIDVCQGMGSMPDWRVMGRKISDVIYKEIDSLGDTIRCAQRLCSRVASTRCTCDLLSKGPPCTYNRAHLRRDQAAVHARRSPR